MDCFRLIDKQKQIRQIFKVTRENSQIKTPQITNKCNLKMFVNFVKIISSEMQMRGNLTKRNFLIDCSKLFPSSLHYSAL